VKSVMDIFYSSDVLQRMYAERCVALFSDYIKGNGTYPKAINTLSDIADFVVTQRNFTMPTGKSLCEEFFLATFAALSTDKRKKKEKDVPQPDKVMEKSAPPQKKHNSTELSQGKIFPIPAKPGKTNIRNQPMVKKFTESIPTFPRFLEYFPNPRQQTFSSNGGLHPVSDCAICAEFGFYNAADALGKKRILSVPQKIYVVRIHSMVNSNGAIGDWTGFDVYLDTKDSSPPDAPVISSAPPEPDEAMMTDELVIHDSETNWADIPGE